MYAAAILREFLHRNAYKNTRAALFAFGPRGPHAKGSARIYSTYMSTIYIEGLLESGMPRQLALALAVVCASPVSFVT